MPTRHFFPSPRFRIYSNHSALESLAVSWEWWVGQGWGQGERLGQAHRPLGPDCTPPPAQLIPLQAPLKTMLQFAVMPLINGRGGGHEEGGGSEGDLGRPRLSPLSPPTERTRRGVQIPLPEGMDFVREVVTNHAVSGGNHGEGGCSGPLLLQAPLFPPPLESYTDPSSPLHRLCPYLGTLFPDSTPNAYSSFRS